MAENGPRCTRRKQANPRRKHVDLDNMAEEVDSDHLGPPAPVTTSPSPAPSPHRSQSPSQHERLPTPSTSPTPSKDEGPRNGFPRANGLAVHKAEREEEEEEGDEGGARAAGMVNGHVAGVPNGVLRRDPVDGEALEEDEKIREYLRRSDTAVIFPEPVDKELDKGGDVQTPTDAVVSRAPEVPQEHLTTSAHQQRPLAPKTEPSQDAPSHPEEKMLPSHVCPKCNAAFSQKEHLEKHALLHSTTPQSCPLCSKSFANVYRLQRHLLSHDESAVLRKFKCTECGKAFKFKHHLKEHIRIHSGEKPFVCNNCGKRFSHSGSFSSHTTSKKCLVMNLKMRKTDTKTSRGRGANQGGTTTAAATNNAFRPIIPKYGESLDVAPTSYMPSSDRFPMFMPEYHASSQQRSLAPTQGQQQSGQQQHEQQPPVQPFLPATAYASFPFHPLLASHYQAAASGMPPHYVPLAGFPEVTHLLQSRMQRSPHASPENLSGSDTAVSSSNCSSMSLSTTTNHGKTATCPSPSQPSIDQTLTNTDLKSDVVLDSNLSSLPANKDLNAVKKILEIVDATVSRQQVGPSKTIGNKNGLLPELLAASPPNRPLMHAGHSSLQSPTSLPSERSGASSGDEAKKGYGTKDDSQCRYCNESFKSKIDLHQHERYLCKKNREIPPGNMEENQIEQIKEHGDATSTPVTDKGTELVRNQETGEHSSLASTESDEDSHRDSLEDEVVTVDGKKLRVRSTLSEDTVRFLRAHYDSNPRPSKHELMRLAHEVNCSVRVIQVWFQNNRAKERRQGRLACASTPANRPRELTSLQQALAVPSPQMHSALPHQAITIPQYKPYHPPSPTSFSSPTPAFNGSATSTTPPYPPASAHARVCFPAPGSLVTPCSVSVSMQCLTSVRNFAGKDGPYSPPPLPQLENDQPLDLSVKSRQGVASPSSPNSPGVIKDQYEVLNLSQKSSRTGTPQKDGLDGARIPSPSEQRTESPQNGGAPVRNEESSLVRYMRNLMVPSSFHHHRIQSPSNNLSDADDQTTQDSAQTSRIPPLSNYPPAEDLTMQISFHVNSLIAGEPIGRPPSSSDAGSREGTDSPGLLDGSKEGGSPLMADVEDHTDGGGSSPKSYKKKKKQFKQMDPDREESQSAMEDSPGPDDDANPKRRKSWKQHKVDSLGVGGGGGSEEGIYSCDQCDKTFSKQSSLARHKYEHSGQRPHKCDVCSKAFKHKHHLTEHKRLHSGEKPFQCKKCLKRFSHSGSYSQHMNHRYSYCKPYRE